MKGTEPTTATPTATRDESSPDRIARKPARRRRRAPWSVWFVVVIVLVAAVAVYAVYHATSPGSSSCSGGAHSLVVWTYPSLFDSGSSPNATRAAVFDGFQNSTGSTLCIVYVQSDLAAALGSAKPGQLPDVVVGLDELEAPRADAEGLLVPYTSPALADVPSSIVANLAPDHSVTPYEFGYLGLDYNLAWDAQNGHPFSEGDLFQNVQSEPSAGAAFYYPDPVAGDITGEEFLAWEVEFESNVLHQNWTDFWRAASQNQIHPVDSWDDCWDEFSSNDSPTCLSYTTDPATEQYFGAGGWMNSTVAQYEGRNYSWQTDYGVGIVKGAHNLTLAQDFVNWMLSGTVQNLVPENEWEYPANDTVALPPEFSAAIPPSTITAVNQYTTPSQSSAALTSWVLQLSSIES